MSPLLTSLALFALALAQEPEASAPAEPATPSPDAAPEVGPATAAEPTAEPTIELPNPSVDTLTSDELQSDFDAATAQEDAATAVLEAPPHPCKYWQSVPRAPHAACIRVREGNLTFATYGSERFMLNSYPDFAVDARGTTVGQGVAIDHRLRVGAGLAFGALRLSTEWDLFTGQIAGDTWDIPGDIDERRRWTRDGVSRESFIPRRAALSAMVPDPAGGKVPLVVLEGGLIPANDWGLGLVANSGTEDTLFGRVDGGDRVMRLRVTSAPITKGDTRLPLFLSLGFDHVIEDDTARLREGQIAYHLLASLVYRNTGGRELGLFYTYRTQQEPDGAPRPTQVSVFDAYVKWPIPLGASGWILELANEDVLIQGRTERTLAYADPSKTDVLSGAIAIEATVKHPTGLLLAHLKGGYTSGTGDPDSGDLHDFTADRNFNVGLVLFDELMGGIEAGTYALLQDRAFTGGPPPGADGIVTEGSVRRAAWLWPSVELHPLGWFDVRAGYLAAWSTGPIAQPFYTTRNGGTPTNHLDQPTDGRFLGHEVQWGLGFGRGAKVADWPLRPQLWVEGGHAFASESLGGGTHTVIRATVQALW